MKKLVQVCAAGAAVPFGLVICIALTAGGASAVSPNLNLGGLGCVTPVAPGTVTADGQALTSEQINNATIIYQVANGLGLPRRQR